MLSQSGEEKHDRHNTAASPAHTIHTRPRTYTLSWMLPLPARCKGCEELLEASGQGVEIRVPPSVRRRWLGASYGHRQHRERHSTDPSGRSDTGGAMYDPRGEISACMVTLSERPIRGEARCCCIRRPVRLNDPSRRRRPPALRRIFTTRHNPPGRVLSSQSPNAPVKTYEVYSKMLPGLLADAPNADGGILLSVPYRRLHRP